MMYYAIQWIVMPDSAVLSISVDCGEVLCSSKASDSAVHTKQFRGLWCCTMQFKDVKC